ncbi:MAG TPA: AAA family ATPase [Egibacteraceae bacterium]|nr:AAA family ATPase [Egibacteraceae bacterium]
MKIAITGKGGSGKTMVAGALVRHLADRGHDVVAVDADPNPNLGIALGVQAGDVEGMQSILGALVASGYTHDQPLPDPDDLVARYGVTVADRVALVATGKIERPTDSCLCCGSHLTTRRFFGDLPATDRVVVADLEAGLNDLLWARPGADDVVLVVAEPSAKAVEVATRAAGLAREMGVQRIVAVANRADADADAKRLAAALATDTVVAIPDDPAVAAADHRGVSAYDTDRASPAMAAVGDLADVVLGAAV